MATPDEQARELAEELGLTHRMEIAMLASALRHREAETWERAAKHVESAAGRYGMEVPTAYGLVKELRARAAQPQESGKLLPPSPL